MKNIALSLTMALIISGINSFAQNNNDLQVETKEKITLNYSKGITKEKATPYIIRIDKAIQYYHNTIGWNDIELQMFVLKKDDWKEYSYTALYGMPHAVGNKLIMAFDDNPFWDNSIPKKERLTAKQYQHFCQVYKTKDGDVSTRTFWDLLSVHELGHIVASSNNVYIPKKWFNEFFANYFLHAYVAKCESNHMDQLTELIDVNEKLLAGEKYTTLDEFETNYGDGMTGQNYVWYQARIQQIVESVYNLEGDTPLIKMMTVFKDNKKEFKSSEDFITFIEKEISPTIAAYFRSF